MCPRKKGRERWDTGKPEEALGQPRHRRGPRDAGSPGSWERQKDPPESPRRECDHPPP